MEKTKERLTTVLPDHIRYEMSDLETRAEVVSAKGMAFMRVGMIFAVAVAIAGLTLHFSGPVAHITSLHIPEAVTKALATATVPTQIAPTADDLGQISAGLTHIYSVPVAHSTSLHIPEKATKALATATVPPPTAPQFDDLSQTSAGYFGGFILVMMIVITGISIATRHMLSASWSIIAVVAFAGAGFFQFFMSESNHDTSTGNQALTHMATSGEYQAMSELMTKRNIPTVLQDYVLTQAIVVNAGTGRIPKADLAHASAMLKNVDNAADKGEEKDSISGEVLYSLENTILGETVSNPAKEYYSSSEKWTSNASSWMSVSSVFFAATSLLGLGLTLFGRVMRSRVKRIKALSGK